jgi:hypothetical protein
LTTFPVVHDTITTLKQNHLGQKSLSLADQAYNKLAKPILPYLAKPYQYVSPYVTKVDSLGDQTLSKVEKTFPIVKKPTGELYENATGLALLPLRKGMETKDYVMKTYKSECKKVGGEGLLTMGKAAVTTTLIVSSDALSSLSNYLGAKKEQTKQAANEKIQT